jgi:hypothetical protein
MKTHLPLTNRKTKLSLIHIAKASLGLTDDAYRALLEGAAGVNSAANIVHEHQFNAVMKAFKNLGFKRNGTSKTISASRPKWTDRWGGTEDQRAKIEVLWQQCARNKTERALRAFVKRIAKVDSPMWLDVELARKVILALEAMVRKPAKKKVKCSS